MRLELQAKLEEVLGARRVYFQPPASVKMSYPAIVYSRSGIDNIYANDEVYGQSNRYEIIVIDKNPDSVIVRKISRLPKCVFVRHYVADNVHHDVFNLYL